MTTFLLWEKDEKTLGSRGPPNCFASVSKHQIHFFFFFEYENFAEIVWILSVLKFLLRSPGHGGGEQICHRRSLLMSVVSRRGMC